MLKALIKDKCFLTLSVEHDSLSHAYMLYSQDKILNNDVAELFAMSIFCGHSTPCFECEACKRSLIYKNPDLIILDKPNILVEDIEGLIDSANLKPMIYPYKIVIIKNAENVNEIAQNKLLKTLEDPNDTLKFILTTASEEKLLPTIRSRLKKVYLSLDKVELLKEELLYSGVKEEFINKNFNLTEMIENSKDKDYMTYLDNITKLFLDLSSTKDIPNLVSNLKLSSNNKFVYLSLISKLFDTIYEKDTLFNENLKANIKSKYTGIVVGKIKGLVENSYKKLKSNVNANYVFDMLLYKILREKYLCK